MLDRQKLIDEIMLEINTFASTQKPAAMAVAVDLPFADDPLLSFYGLWGPGNAPPDGTSIWQIGSLTKTFTATLLAAAICEGIFALESFIQPYAPHGVMLPRYSIWNKTIPIRFIELATHVSGLPMDPLNVPVERGYSVSEMFAYLQNYAVAVQPGTNWNYSNLGFGLLANLLQNAMNFSTYQDGIQWLKATYDLYMPSTVIDLNHEQKKRFWPGFSAPGVAAPVNTITWPALNGSGALYSSLDDVLIWLRANMHRAYHKFAPVVQITQEEYFSISPLAQLFWKNGTIAMGLGWEKDILQTENRQSCWGKGGATNGFTSFIGMLPSERSGIVILCNSAWVWPQSLGIRILSQISNSMRCNVA